jgi:lipoprotein NlpI
MQLDPKLAQPHNYLGKVFMGEGNIPSAITEFEEALRLYPDFPGTEKTCAWPSQTAATP